MSNRPEAVETTDDAAGQLARFEGQNASSRLLMLQPSEFVFQESARRHGVYKVEKGVIAIFESGIGRPPRLVAMASRGDYVGLGCLTHYRENARAAVASVVRFLPMTEFIALAALDPSLKRKQVIAVNRDFQAGRRLITDRGRSSPTKSVAALIVAIIREEGTEGGGISPISRHLSTSDISNIIDLDPKLIERAVTELKKLGVAAEAPDAKFIILNIEALEGIALGDWQLLTSGQHDATPLPLNMVCAKALSALLERFKRTTYLRLKEEVRETLWLVSAIGGMSVGVVGLATALAFFLF